jgi:hypothetical protein
MTKNNEVRFFSWPNYQYLGGNRVELNISGVFQNCFKFIQQWLEYNQWWIKFSYNDLQEQLEEQRSKRQKIRRTSLLEFSDQRQKLSIGALSGNTPTFPGRIVLQALCCRPHYLRPFPLLFLLLFAFAARLL